MISCQLTSRKSSFINNINSFHKYPEAQSQLIKNFGYKPQLEYNPINSVNHIIKKKLEIIQQIVKVHNQTTRSASLRKRRQKLRLYSEVRSIPSPIEWNRDRNVLQPEPKQVQVITELFNNYDITKTIPEENLEYDISIQMTPIKKRTARIRIKSIENAKMHIVEP